MMRGPDVPKDHSTDRLASLVDIYPTIMQTVGAADDGLPRPGINLNDLSRAGSDDRAILSEYHDGGSPAVLWRGDLSGKQALSSHHTNAFFTARKRPSAGVRHQQARRVYPPAAGRV